MKSCFPLLCLVLLAQAFWRGPCAIGLNAAGITGQSAKNEPVCRGFLVIAGGGILGPEIIGRFIELAGGADAPIVLIPTADAAETFNTNYRAMKNLRDAGACNVSILHTRNRTEANTEDFVKPLRKARGVWFGGGRQWRLVDVYLDTLTERELHALLMRGGVIGGTSAGASIQASYLVRGAPEGNHIMMAKGYERGFGFLPNSAVDQHVLARKREADLAAVIRAHPELLGIGVDESTAIIVHGDQFEVFGKSKVIVYGASVTPPNGKPYLVLSPGSVFNLKRRQLEQ